MKRAVNLKIKKYLLNAGVISVFLTPLIFILTPILLTDALCANDGCGYAGAGMGFYALFFSGATLVVGLVLIIISAFLPKN